MLGPLRFTNVLAGLADFVYPGPTTDMQSPASAGAVNGQTYRVYAQSFDMSEWEISDALYDGPSETFQRPATVVANSLGTTAKVDFSDPPQVFVIDTSASAGVVTASNATPLMDGTAAAGSSAAYARGDHRHPSDTSRLAVAGGQTVTGGFSLTPYNAGNMGTGTFTFNPSNGNYQYASNTGAVQIQVPATDCAMDILITNSATAGAITFSGSFTVNSNTGEATTTTNGHKFIVSIRRINGVSTYLIKALQ